MCNKDFYFKDYLRKHKLKIHGNFKRQNCDYCQKTFAKKKDLLRHYTNEHANNEIKSVN